GHRHVEDEQRRGPLRARIGQRGQHSHPEDAPAGDHQPLLADAREPVGSEPRRSVCTASAHPGDPSGAGSSHNRAMSAEEVLATPLQFLKGVGPRRAADLEHAGLVTLEDLLYRFPVRYEDRSRLQPIASLAPGQTVSVAGRVLACGLRSTRRPGFKIFEAAIDDGTGSLRVVWLNQPFLRDVFTRGQHVVLYGAIEMRGSVTMQLTNPQYEVLDDEDGETIHTGRIVPVYERTGTITPKMQRRLVYDALQRLPADLPDHLPEAIRIRLGMPSRLAALVATHFPPDEASLDALNRFATAAQQRLIFEEAFTFQMGVLARRQTAAAEQKPAAVRVD